MTCRVKIGLRTGPRNWYSTSRTLRSGDSLRTSRNNRVLVRPPKAASTPIRATRRYVIAHTCPRLGPVFNFHLSLNRSRYSPAEACPGFVLSAAVDHARSLGPGQQSELSEVTTPLRHRTDETPKNGSRITPRQFPVAPRSRPRRSYLDQTRHDGALLAAMLRVLDHWLRRVAPSHCRRPGRARGCSVRASAGGWVLRMGSIERIRVPSRRAGPARPGRSQCSISSPGARPAGSGLRWRSSPSMPIRSVAGARHYGTRPGRHFASTTTPRDSYGLAVPRVDASTSGSATSRGRWV